MGVNNMAIVKATYTRQATGAKASIRYIQNRAGKDGERVSRTLFGSDGLLGRYEAYHMVDAAETGSIFFRFVISPDPKGEDSERDLFLREVTERTMNALEERLHTQVSWVAAEHNDHAPHRHVHVVAVVPGRLQVHDFQSMRQAATEAALQQRHERDLAREQREHTGKEQAQWELHR